MIKNILILVFVFFNLKSIAQQKYVVYFDFNKDIPNANVSKDFAYWLKNNQNIEVFRIDGL